MNKIVAVLASAALALAPIGVSPASAQMHGGGHGGGGGWHGGGGGWHGGGGGWHGGGWHGGGGYWHGGYGCCWGYGFPWFIGGVGLGLAFASPWYYPAYYGYPPYYGYVGSTVTTLPYDDYNEYGQGAAPPEASPAPGGPQACGQWVWDQAAGRYNWVGC
jgi:hypothetical protein